MEKTITFFIPNSSRVRLNCFEIPSPFDSNFNLIQPVFGGPLRDFSYNGSNRCRSLCCKLSDNTLVAKKCSRHASSEHATENLDKCHPQDLTTPLENNHSFVSQLVVSTLGRVQKIVQKYYRCPDGTTLQTHLFAK